LASIRERLENKGLIDLLGRPFVAAKAMSTDRGMRMESQPA
jgi:hypothetical protein